MIPNHVHDFFKEAFRFDPQPFSKLYGKTASDFWSNFLIVAFYLAGSVGCELPHDVCTVWFVHIAKRGWWASLFGSKNHGWQGSALQCRQVGHLYANQAAGVKLACLQLHFFLLCCFIFPPWQQIRIREKGVEKVEEEHYLLKKSRVEGGKCHEATSRVQTAPENPRRFPSPIITQWQLFDQ